ncbi:class A beta-lactamase-related serine hydrolase [Williamsia herbipolensis]|uniref:Class A beta-lactamase-related serine hydrolase n=1 Tax=Williamsia herbipolensis TaxID=1603258 RepID=A0AAU4JWU3_9NOCA|nr:serine hydrolase [Williamsia herbipolensis]
MPRRAASFLAGLFVTVAALVVPTSTGPASAAPCPPPPAADTSTARGWVGYLAAHPKDYGLVVTDGRRVTVSHNADRAYPTASASKLINLAVYARAVASGRITPTQTVSVNEWERWYLPIDGGAHVQALEYLKLPPLTGAPGSARPASLRVSLAQLADVMIRFSDSAAPDTLRAVLGDAGFDAVMRQYGLRGLPPLNAALYLGLIDPTLTTQARQQAAARRYHDDARYRAAVFAAAPRLTALTTSAQVDRSYSQPARGLNRLIGAIADGSFGPGAPLARSILEYQGPGPDGSVLGFKGGSLLAPDNSVLTENFEFRTPAGRISTATLLVRGLSRADYEKSNYAQQTLLLGLVRGDAATVAAVQCATGGH